MPATTDSNPGPSTTSDDLTSDDDPDPAGDSEDESCECSFCYGAYCQDGEEWLKCSCGRWVHEKCVEEIILDEQDQERFCPFCINCILP